MAKSGTYDKLDSRKKRDHRFPIELTTVFISPVAVAMDMIEEPKRMVVDTERFMFSGEWLIPVFDFNFYER